MSEEQPFFYQIQPLISKVNMDNEHWSQNEAFKLSHTEIKTKCFNHVIAWIKCTLFCKNFIWPWRSILPLRQKGLVLTCIALSFNNSQIIQDIKTEFSGYISVKYGTFDYLFWKMKDCCTCYITRPIIIWSTKHFSC